MSVVEAEQEVYRVFVRELFGHRCVRCQTPTDVVHEIEPKSLRPRDWWLPENGVLLCSRCHEYFHACGTRNRKADLLRLRARALQLVGK